METISGGTTATIDLAFAGPYGWLRDQAVPCVFDAPEASRPGIYLWTIPSDEGHLAFYIGETGRSFSARLTEHLSAQLSGFYEVYDAAAFARGEKILRWRGMYGAQREQGIERFAARLPELAEDLAALVGVMRFHLAPLECEAGLRRRVESALADHLYAQDGLVGSFLAEGIVYDRSFVPASATEVNCRWSVPVRGAPAGILLSVAET